jgi:predicted transcriptional regulator
MHDPSSLSRRERQIMDILYAAGEATVRFVQARLPRPPTDMAVRRMLQILEEKGELRDALKDERSSTCRYIQRRGPVYERCSTCSTHSLTALSMKHSPPISRGEFLLSRRSWRACEHSLNKPGGRALIMNIATVLSAFAGRGCSQRRSLTPRRWRERLCIAEWFRRRATSRLDRGTYFRACRSLAFICSAAMARPPGVVGARRG